jgi:hypothetical protein
LAIDRALRLLRFIEELGQFLAGALVLKLGGGLLDERNEGLWEDLDNRLVKYLHAFHVEGFIVGLLQLGPRAMLVVEVCDELLLSLEQIQVLVFVSFEWNELFVLRMTSMQLLEHLIEVESRRNRIEVDRNEVPFGAVLALDASAALLVSVCAPEIISPSVPELWSASDSVDEDVSAKFDQVPDVHLGQYHLVRLGGGFLVFDIDDGQQDLGALVHDCKPGPALFVKW